MHITLITRLWRYNQLQKLSHSDEKTVLLTTTYSPSPSPPFTVVLPRFEHGLVLLNSNFDKGGGRIIRSRSWKCHLCPNTVQGLKYFATSCSLPTLNWNQLPGASDSTWVSTFWRHFMMCIVHLSLETLRIRGRRRQWVHLRCCNLHRDYSNSLTMCSRTFLVFLITIIFKLRKREKFFLAYWYVHHKTWN